MFILIATCLLSAVAYHTIQEVVQQPIELTRLNGKDFSKEKTIQLKLIYLDSTEVTVNVPNGVYKLHNHNVIQTDQFDLEYLVKFEDVERMFLIR
jgi:hypothetical protein